MTTAEKYRQLEKSPAINIARYIFSCIKSTSTNSILGNEIVEIKTGKTPSKQNKKFYEDDYLNWFKPDEIGSEKNLFEAKDKLSRYAYENNQATIYEPDTILINAIGDVGRISVLKNKASSNQQITGIRLNEKIDVDYAYFYLLANRDYFYVDLFQTTLPIVNQKKINSIPFNYPDIIEQKNIVEGLVKIDEIKTINDLGIIDDLNWNEDYKNTCRNFFSVQFNSKDISTELTHQLTLVKKLRQQLLQDAVQGKLVPQNPSDEPASELLKKIKAEKQKLIAEGKLKKDKELPVIKAEEIPFEIPEGWIWCKLGEICNYGSSPKAEPKDLNNETWVLDLEDIEKETSNLLCKIRFSERNSLSTKSVFKKGYILYSKLRPYLDKVIVADEDGVCTTEILPLKLYCNLNPFYIRFTLKRIDFLKYVNSVTKGMKMPRLGTNEGQLALIPLPPLSEQHLIVQKLDELMKTCDALEASIKESAAQNEKLLQQVLREALRKE